MRRLASVLLWSAISAAFLGPGTVTVAARAGAEHGAGLLWALLFATVACYLLQEACARVAAGSGGSLAAALRLRFGTGALGSLFGLLVPAAVVFGCAAYQTGNVLGAAAGLDLLFSWSPRVSAGVVSACALGLLALGRPRRVAGALFLLVAAMAAAFAVAATQAPVHPDAVAAGLLLPRLPAGGLWLALGLVGTTVVPYNLFLGTALARGERLGDVRFGLAVSVAAGGAVSVSVLLAGTAVEGAFSFERLAGTLREGVGAWGPRLLGAGLFAAGLTSAVTAPWAAGATAAGAAEGMGRAPGRVRRWRKGTLGAVWAVGAVFGTAGVRPIPAITLAQALNGLLLPALALAILLLVRDARIVGERLRAGPLTVLPLLAVCVVTAALGLFQFFQAL